MFFMRGSTRQLKTYIKYIYAPPGLYTEKQLILRNNEILEMLCEQGSKDLVLEDPSQIRLSAKAARRLIYFSLKNEFQRKRKKQCIKKYQV